MNKDSQLLQSYLDGELPGPEAASFRQRLDASPALQRELAELIQVGSAVREWADTLAPRAAPLLEQTMRRARAAELRQRRHLAVGVAVVAALLLLLPSAHGPFSAGAPVVVGLSQRPEPAAAIERLEAADRQAQVFVVGSSSTPVVWLVDDEEDATGPDPG